MKLKSFTTSALLLASTALLGACERLQTKGELSIHEPNNAKLKLVGVLEGSAKITVDRNLFGSYSVSLSTNNDLNSANTTIGLPRSKVTVGKNSLKMKIQGLNVVGSRRMVSDSVWLSTKKVPCTGLGTCTKYNSAQTAGEYGTHNDCPGTKKLRIQNEGTQEIIKVRFMDGQTEVATFEGTGYEKSTHTELVSEDRCIVVSQ